jgi:hypothetical protein
MIHAHRAHAMGRQIAHQIHAGLKNAADHHGGPILFRANSIRNRRLHPSEF